MELAIDILHSIPGRVRLKFTPEVADAEKIRFQVMEHEGINSFYYSPVTRTVLIRFEDMVVEVQEILIRTAVAFSLQYGLRSVKLSQPAPNEFITSKGLLAGVTILSTGMLSLFSRLTLLGTAMSWLSAITTTAAVLEHAGFDYRKKGSVDPEVLSLAILANSVLNNKNLLLPSALTWITTFGRHFSRNEGEGVILDIKKDTSGAKAGNYDINVSKLSSKGSFADLLNVFAENFLTSQGGFNNTIFEKSKDLLKLHSKNLEGIGDKIKGIVLNFNQ
jgi:hypothetical protein